MGFKTKIKKKAGMSSSIGRSDVESMKIEYNFDTKKANSNIIITSNGKTYIINIMHTFPISFIKEIFVSANDYTIFYTKMTEKNNVVKGNFRGIHENII